MKIIILREQKDGELVRLRSVDVPDNASDPETVGWNMVSRTGDLGPGNYAAIRAGKLFQLAPSTQNVSKSKGVMS